MGPQTPECTFCDISLLGIINSKASNILDEGLCRIGQHRKGNGVRAASKSYTDLRVYLAEN